MTEEKPLYRHDCDVCLPLGRYDLGEDKYDLYFCPKGGPTVIARYDSEGSRYMSGLEIAKSILESKSEDALSGVHPLVEALKRTRSKGLLPDGKA